MDVLCTLNWKHWMKPLNIRIARAIKLLKDTHTHRNSLLFRYKWLWINMLCARALFFPRIACDYSNSCVLLLLLHLLPGIYRMSVPHRHRCYPRIASQSTYQTYTHRKLCMKHVWTYHIDVTIANTMNFDIYALAKYTWIGKKTEYDKKKKQNTNWRSQRVWNLPNGRCRADRDRRENPTELFTFVYCNFLFVVFFSEQLKYTCFFSFKNCIQFQFNHW